MNILFIREYIKKMTYDDIRNIALKNGIVLDNDEVSSIYKYIKNNYLDYLNGRINIDDVMESSKKILSDFNYNKFLELYDVYKDKI